MIDWIDARLHIWAANVIRDQDGALGYPRRTVEARLMVEGAGASIHAPPGPRTVDMPPYVVEVDRAVARMPEDLREVVKVAYLTYGDRKIQAETLARRLKRRVRRQGFVDMIDRSHHWLAGHLAR